MQVAIRPLEQESLDHSCQHLEERFVAKTVASGELPYYERRCRFVRIYIRLNKTELSTTQLYLGVNKLLEDTFRALPDVANWKGTMI